MGLWKEQQKAIFRKLLKRIPFCDYSTYYKPVSAPHIANVNTHVSFWQNHLQCLHCTSSVLKQSNLLLILFKYLYITVLSIYVKTAYPCVYVCIKPSIKISDLPHSVVHTECYWVLQLPAHFLPKTLCNQLFFRSLTSDSNCSELLLCCFLAFVASRYNKGEFVHVRVATSTYACRLLLCVPGTGNAEQSCRRTASSTRKVIHSWAPLHLLKCSTCNEH